MPDKREYDTDDVGNDTSRRSVGKTPSGSDIVIGLEPNGYYKVKFWEGGVLPVELRGKYTNYRRAEEDVQRYLHTLKTDDQVKGKRNVKSHSTG